MFNHISNCHGPTSVINVDIYVLNQQATSNKFQNYSDTLPNKNNYNDTPYIKFKTISSIILPLLQI